MEIPLNPPLEKGDFKRVFPLDPFSENSYTIRRDDEAVRDRLPAHKFGHYLARVLCGGAGGRFSCKKEPPGLLQRSLSEIDVITRNHGSIFTTQDSSRTR